MDGGGITVLVPQCVTSAYQIVFRGLVEPLDPLLQYMDTPAGSRDDSQKPDISSLVELKDVAGVYSRFTWNVGDVPEVIDQGGTLITADFVESSGLNPSDLDNGIGGMEVVLLLWKMTVGASTVVGEGKMSVVGLDDDTVRITIVDFNPWYARLGQLLPIRGDGLQYAPRSRDAGLRALRSRHRLHGYG